MTSAFLTRVSFGSQLRVALDDMKASGRIRDWCIVHDELLGNRYQIIGKHPSGSFCDTPGGMADYLNRIGYDIRFGKGA